MAASCSSREFESSSWASLAEKSVRCFYKHRQQCPEEKQILRIPSDIFELQLESEQQTEDLLQQRIRYALDPLNNNPTVFAISVADDEHDDDSHEHDPVLQLNNDVEHHSNS